MFDDPFGDLVVPELMILCDSPLAFGDERVA
jgi:hypothetical protein